MKHERDMTLKDLAHESRRSPWARGVGGKRPGPGEKYDMAVGTGVRVRDLKQVDKAAEALGFNRNIFARLAIMHFTGEVLELDKIQRAKLDEEFAQRAVQERLASLDQVAAETVAEDAPGWGEEGVDWDWGE